MARSRMVCNFIAPPRIRSFESPASAPQGFRSNSDAVIDVDDFGAPEEASYSLSFMTPNPYFGPRFCIIWDSVEVPTKAAIKPELLQLQGSKDRCGHQSSSQESRMASKYPEGKRAIRICSAACGLVKLARASGLSHWHLCMGRS
ncbi:hypothetical protein RF11_13913 [Thelohanellus kitauei]|uniref:Uncharacterized protein n=1 Tax=Thelohanellus kitauei TaxID=669202 RepID=A0A0C2M1J0_THEKT|nr:hypothetical protein RF11_13913 [Thelohanellus kitauei]